MNKEIEFRRLRWLFNVQNLLQQEKKILMVNRLAQLNNEETAIEFNNNELVRLLEVEQRILELYHTYDFSHEPTREDIAQYLYEMLGHVPTKNSQWTLYP